MSTTSHPALEWLVRRRDGESAALIGRRDGVPAATVRRVTDPYGPFPRATRQLGRTHIPEAIADARARRWVHARRRGQSVIAIAAREGLAHQLVSRMTADYGPFPAPEVIEEWAQARRAGRTLAQIAAADHVGVTVVSRMTRGLGPFTPIGPRLPDGVIGVKGLAWMVGVSEPTVLRWVRQDRTPRTGLRHRVRPPAVATRYPHPLAQRRRPGHVPGLSSAVH